MQHVKVRIIEKNNPEPAFPEYAAKNPEEAKLAGVAILEKGTECGNSSLGFVIETDDGKVYFARVTGRIFRSLADAHRGACKRWGTE